MGKYFDFARKFFSPPNLRPPQGVKTPSKMPLFVEKNVKKVDSASKNGPNLMYDGLLEAYGQLLHTHANFPAVYAM